LDYTKDFKFDFSFSISTFQVSINEDEEIITLGFKLPSLFKILAEIESYQLLQTPQIDAEILTIGKDIKSQDNGHQ
jgi:hypothetical protein